MEAAKIIEIESDKHYIFKSERLGFRDWKDTDLGKLAEINADPEVMKFFPATQSREQTKIFIDRMSLQFKEKGFCYFAVDRLDTLEFTGFIGLSVQTFEADFNPCIDVGWRLKQSAWNKGFATEGAKKCLDYAFNHLKLKKINAMAPKANLPSINVMKKLGMKEVRTFDHPLLLNDARLRECILYETPGNLS
ncbi:RimJ/RimL family protein N-acetyltransferase [Pedobacter cryoconitis]|uniref:RimJ/RimL family protein N-acetyltransferase n=1 Tax=Pedobacter cryoconitis TaxID=188932 RepID=A0A7W8ZM20_9SPHI|nr:GNAT family N-acetyltransferase [Pedobacter cryoconitis]MBB5636395.1 RimJ/RimL family protein N-acetyltransferase [Pedobacter cryoconitis]MBB6274549.1 RimJ/RimL family protein N-acetyltransferase [Pedobacter cryoconitis]